MYNRKGPLDWFTNGFRRENPGDWFFLSAAVRKFRCCWRELRQFGAGFRARLRDLLCETLPYEIALWRLRRRLRRDKIERRDGDAIAGRRADLDQREPAHRPPMRPIMPVVLAWICYTIACAQLVAAVLSIL